MADIDVQTDIPKLYKSTPCSLQTIYKYDYIKIATDIISKTE